MTYDMRAVLKAYPNAVRCDATYGPFDKDGNKITIEQSKVDTARTELNTAAAAVKYRKDREGLTEGITDTIYPSIGDQLDNLYKDIVAGKVDATGEFAKAIKATKDKYPKP